MLLPSALGILLAYVMRKASWFSSKGCPCRNLVAFAHGLFIGKRLICMVRQKAERHAVKETAATFGAFDRGAADEQVVASVGQG